MYLSMATCRAYIPGRYTLEDDLLSFRLRTAITTIDFTSAESPGYIYWVDPRRIWRWNREMMRSEAMDRVEYPTGRGEMMEIKPVIPQPSTDITSLGLGFPADPRLHIPSTRGRRWRTSGPLTTPSPSPPISLSPPSAGERPCLVYCRITPPSLPHQLPPSLPHIPSPVDVGMIFLSLSSSPQEVAFVTICSRYEIGERLNTRVVELAGVPRGIQRLYALLEDDSPRDSRMVEEEPYASAEAWARSIRMSTQANIPISAAFRPIVIMCTHMSGPIYRHYQNTYSCRVLSFRHKHQAMRLREMSDMQAELFSTCVSRGGTVDSRAEARIQITGGSGDATVQSSDYVIVFCLDKSWAPTTKRRTKLPISITPSEHMTPRIHQADRPKPLVRIAPMEMEAIVRTGITEGTCKLLLKEKMIRQVLSARDEIMKLEIEMLEPKIKGNDFQHYMNVSHELTLICTKFVQWKTEKVDKYLSGLPDNIYGNVKAAKPKTLDETIELANDLMDRKLLTYAERQSDNKRRADDSSRNNHNHQQQPFKRQNVAKVYNMGTGERKPYEVLTGHFKEIVQNERNKNGGNGNAQGWVYAVGNAEKRGNAPGNPDANVVTDWVLSDVIIGMDWLRRYHAVIICDEKLVQVPYGNETLTFRGLSSTYIRQEGGERGEGLGKEEWRRTSRKGKIEDRTNRRIFRGVFPRTCQTDRSGPYLLEDRSEIGISPALRVREHRSPEDGIFELGVAITSSQVMPFGLTKAHAVVMDLIESDSTWGGKGREKFPVDKAEVVQRPQFGFNEGSEGLCGITVMSHKRIRCGVNAEREGKAHVSGDAAERKERIVAIAGSSLEFDNWFGSSETENIELDTLANGDLRSVIHATISHKSKYSIHPGSERVTRCEENYFGGQNMKAELLAVSQMPECARVTAKPKAIRIASTTEILTVQAPLPTLTATATATTTTTTTTLPPIPPQPQQGSFDSILIKRIDELEQHMADMVEANQALEERLDKQGSRLYKLENLNIPHQVSKAVDKIVTDAVNWAIQAPLRDRFRDLPEAYMKEILHHRMWESNSYQAHEDHKMLYEALEKSMAREHTDQLQTDMAEVRRKKKKRHASPKTPLGSPPHQPPPPPSSAGSSGTPGAFGASGSFQLPPPPPPLYTHQSDQSTSTAALSSSKTAASAEYMAWMTTDTRLKPFVLSIPEELHMDDDTTHDKQVQSSGDEDIDHNHISTVNLRQNWWKPLIEDRPATSEPAWSIPSSDLPVPVNNWASALASTYAPPLENSLLAQTGDMEIFMDWFCKKQRITKLKQQDLEGPAYEIVKVFHPNMIHLQYQMEECHKLLTDQVDESIIRYNVSKPLPLVHQVKSRFNLTSSSTKTWSIYYTVEKVMWIEEECKYDIAAMYGTSHWWFQRQRFYIDRYTSDGDCRVVRTHMRILSVVRIEVFSLYGYDYMKTIVLHRSDLKEYTIAEMDFKYMYPSNFEDLYLLNLQGHLNHLPPEDKKILSTVVNL
ncbi:hypothetical protein Tco_0968926 [Tanacetum coccineum]